MKEGKWKWWDEKGNLIREEVYKGDSLLKIKDHLANIKYSGAGNTTLNFPLTEKETKLFIFYEFYKEADEIEVFNIYGEILGTTEMTATTKENLKEIEITEPVSEIVLKIKCSDPSSKWTFSLRTE